MPPPSMLPRRPPHRARVWSRYLLLLIIPLAIALKAWLDEQEKPHDVSGFSFHRPGDWSYLTETGVKPDGDRIRFAPTAIVAALEQGQGAPLFALTKYPPPHAGINPMIGVNVAFVAAEQPAPAEVLAQSLAQVQSRSGDALEVLEPINDTLVAGLPAARTVLATREPQPGKARDRLTVLAIAAGQLSFLVAGSGAYDGVDRIDEQLAEFASSLSLDRY
ncbi:MAG: hypothetical protein AB7Q81_02605 [Gammaproteobacteria bacterium]